MQSSSSFSSLSNVGPPIEDRRKTPVTSVEDAASEGHTVYFDIRVLEDESALTNLTLARRLIQAALLPADRKNRRNRTVAEMFSSFYPMILGISFLFFFFLIFYLQLIHDIFDLEVGYAKFDDFRQSWMNRVAAANAEKVAILEQLKWTAERKVKLQEEVS